MRHPSGLALTTLAAALVFGAEANAASVTVPSGELRAAVVADLKPHPSSSKTYNEFWTYQIYLDNDIQACLNYSRVNPGPKAPVCGADLTLIGFKGKNYKVAREYDKKNFAFVDSTQQLRVHENIWFQGKLPREHRIHFATQKKGVAYYLDLEFSDIAPGKVWGDGLFKLGGETVGMYVHIPQAKVAGRLAINGDTLQVTGRAYMDHTFQTDMGPKLVEAGFRYVGKAASPAEVGNFLQPREKYGTTPIGYGLSVLQGAVTLRKPSAIKVLANEKSLGLKVPTRLEIDFLDGSRAELQRGQDRFHQSFLEEFNWLEKTAVKAFLGGEVKTFKGMGTLAGQPAAYDFFIVD